MKKKVKELLDKLNSGAEAFDDFPEIRDAVLIKSKGILRNEKTWLF